MSMKVYNAYRLTTRGDPWRLIWKIQRRARAEFTERLRKAYWDAMCRVDLQSDAYQQKLAGYKLTSHPDLAARMNLVREVITKEYKENVVSTRRSTYDLDVSIAVHILDGQFYLRAFCDNISLVGGTLDFLHDMPGVEDYHYQDSTDKPENISSRTWNKRARIWKTLAGGVAPVKQLLLNICDWHNFYQMDPWMDLMQEYYKDPIPFPIPEEVQARELRKLTAFTVVTSAPGLIIADPGHVVIKKGKTHWTTTFNGKRRKYHKSLGAARSYVYGTYARALQKTGLPHAQKGLAHLEQVAGFSASNRSPIRSVAF